MSKVNIKVWNVGIWGLVKVDLKYEIKRLNLSGLFFKTMPSSISIRKL
jgi:hypothetical protein